MDWHYVRVYCNTASRGMQMHPGELVDKLAGSTLRSACSRGRDEPSFTAGIFPFNETRKEICCLTAKMRRFRSANEVIHYRVDGRGSTFGSGWGLFSLVAVSHWLWHAPTQNANHSQRVSLVSLQIFE